MLKRIFCAVSILVLISTARGTTLYDESVSPDLSNSQAAPTALNLSVGTNSIDGSVGGTDKQDWVALTVPVGTQLSSIFLASYSSATDAQGFMGVQTGSSFVGSTTTAGNYLGYVHFGTGATNGGPATNVVGDDLLPLMADPSAAAGAQGFTPPLTSGTYTFLIQQLGGTTNYGFDFVMVPEPGAFVVMVMCGSLMVRRRWGTAG